MAAPQFIPASAPEVARPWIVRLRYSMAAGQFAMVLFVDRVLGILARRIICAARGR